MKKILVFGLLMPILGLAQIRTVDAGGIRFCRNLDWKKVVERAGLERKYIFVDCYTTWCGYCKKMDETVFSSPTVGNLVNQSFISVKIQFDTSTADDEYIKSQYPEAKRIASLYHPSVYPSYLFFTSDGELVHKEIGYLDTMAFVRVITDAMNPQRQYFSLLKRYKEGKIDYANVPQIVTEAEHLDDTSAVSSLERDYIQKYANRLPDSAMRNKANIELIKKYSRQLHSEDRSFKWIGNHVQLIDSIIKKDGFSTSLMADVIYNENIGPEIERAKNLNEAPAWSEIMKRAIDQVGFLAAKTAIWKGKLKWYGLKKDWENYYATAIEKVEAGSYKDKPGEFANFAVLNSYAFGIFQHSDDKLKLETALSWMDLVIMNITDTTIYAGAMYDTKANLLYKLARKEEALKLEERAARIAPRNNEIQDDYRKMQQGMPTW